MVLIAVRADSQSNFSLPGLAVSNWMCQHSPAGNVHRHDQITTSPSMGSSRSTLMPDVAALIVCISSTGKPLAAPILPSRVLRNATTAGSSAALWDVLASTTIFPSSTMKVTQSPLETQSAARTVFGSEIRPLEVILAVPRMPDGRWPFRSDTGQKLVGKWVTKPVVIVSFRHVI